MDDFAHLLSALRLAIVIGGSGAFFALSIAVVCRWLKWAPINITVNVNNYGEAHSIPDDVGTVGEQSHGHSRFCAIHTVGDCTCALASDHRG